MIPVAGVLPLTLLAAALAGAYWLRFCTQSVSLTRSVVKTGAVVALALAAALAYGPIMLIVALLLCALGDYLLSRDGEAAFMSGVAAFAAGHIAYVVLFLTHHVARPEVLLHHNRLILIAVLVGLGLIMAAVLWRNAGKMRLPVLIYIPVIMSMGVAVLAIPALGPLKFATPAAALFIVSDMTLALEMFVLRPGTVLRRLTPYIVWPTYWLAQLGFFLAFAGIPLK